MQTKKKTQTKLVLKTQLELKNKNINNRKHS